MMEDRRGNTPFRIMGSLFSVMTNTFAEETPQDSATYSWPREKTASGTFRFIDSTNLENWQ